MNAEQRVILPRRGPATTALFPGFGGPCFLLPTTTEYTSAPRPREMAVTIQAPALPAVPDYPVASPWSDRVDRTRQQFLDELATQDGWIDLGEKNGVRLSKRYRENVRRQPPFPGRIALSADPLGLGFSCRIRVSSP